MPLPKRLATGPKPIGACRWQPVKALKILAVKPDTIDNALHAVLVIKATSIAAIQELASNISRIQKSRFLILQLVYATLAAAVAKSFPLAAVELGERPFPKWSASVHLKSSLALLSPRDQAGLWGLRL